jgi:hypothetical protein
MERAIRDLVRQRAGDRYEYCRLPQAAVPFVSFHVEHVIAQQHAGSDDPANRAWSCHRCNAFKGTNLSSVDPETGAIVPLFNPRLDSWPEHFALQGAEITGRSPTGRATARLLAFNDSYRLELRGEWLRDHRLED